MRITTLALAGLLAGIAGGLGACTSSGDDGRGSGISESFSADNYRRRDTYGTQNRPDVNHAFTQPSMPTIVNRGN